MKMINESTILTKLSGDGQSYWTIMDTLGNVYKIPQECKEILEMADWTSLQVQEVKDYYDVDSSSSSSSSSDEDEPPKLKKRKSVSKGYLVVVSAYDDPELRTKKTQQQQ